MAVRQAFSAFRIKKLTKERAEKQQALDEINRELEEITADVEAEAEEPTRSDEEMDEMEKHVGELEEKKAELEAAISKIDEDIKAQQDQIEESNENHVAVEEKEQPQEGEVRMNKDLSVIRSGFFAGYQRSYVDNILERQDVKDFIVRMQEVIGNKRAISGSDLGIPTVILPLIREKIYQASKMLKHVKVRRSSGDARQPIMGTVPEAVWTETCKNINELELEFDIVSLDGFSVAGYFDVCRADLEDSDFLSAEFLFSVLTQSIAIATDKAILYGTGVKMPLGIVTRLAQGTQPSGYDPQAPDWVNLSTSHIKQTSADNLTGEAFYSELIGFAKAITSDYAANNKFWAMSEATYLTIQQKLLSFNAAGAIVSAANMTLPIIGGQVEILNFIPEGDVVGGYGDLYSYLERSAIRLEQSNHAKFLQDHALFKAIARGDGMPVIADAFVLFNINAATPTKTVTFAADTANTVSP